MVEGQPSLLCSQLTLSRGKQPALDEGRTYLVRFSLGFLAHSLLLVLGIC